MTSKIQSKYSPKRWVYYIQIIEGSMNTWKLELNVSVQTIFFLGQISKPVNLFKPRFNFQPFGSSGKGKRAHKMTENQLENEPNSNPTGIKNIKRNYFFFPWAVFKVTKKWRWWQVKSNALFLHTLVPSPCGNSSFGSYFPLKIWLLVSPSPPLVISNNYLAWVWDNNSGTGHWQTPQLNWNVFFLFFLTAIQSHRLLKTSKCQAWSWSLISLTPHQKGNDSTSMKSIWFATFKNYCYSSLIC